VEAKIPPVDKTAPVFPGPGPEQICGKPGIAKIQSKDREREEADKKDIT
jgi:hypothetical protein